MMRYTMTNKTHFIRKTVAIVALLLLILPAQASAANVNMSLQASSASVQKDSNVTVEVVLALGSNKSLDVLGKVNYQADKLQYISASSPGTQGPDTSFSSGSYTFDQISTSTPFTGTVSVVKITFRALASSGSTDVSISDAEVGDNDSPPPAKHQVTSSGTTISFTEAQGNNNGQPTEAELEANSGLDDEEPVPITTYTDQTGYPVAIIVQDKNGQAVLNTNVRLGEQTATTDANGIANFENVLAGEYVVSANGTEQTIIVVTGEPTESQDFVLEIKDDSRFIDKILPAILGLGAVLLIALLVFFLYKKLRDDKANNSMSQSDINNSDINKDNTTET